MEISEEDRKQVIRISDERKEFTRGDDGFVYWWPDGSPHGHLTAHHLRLIADELDRRNKKWNNIIEDYFSANDQD